MKQLPPCCASCGELDQERRVCRLLSRPTQENRERLLSMPCDVPRLVRLRFRGHGEEVANRALAAWVSPRHDANTLAWSFGDLPKDARIWCTAWPLRELVRAEVREKIGAHAAPIPGRVSTGAAADPVLFARVAGALARVSELDPVGFAMLIESLCNRFDMSAWRDALGAQDEAISKQRLLAIYRYAVVFFDALRGVHKVARAALTARRFTPGDPTEAMALSTLREAGLKSLAMSELRVTYARGVRATIAVLAEDKAFGGLVGPRAERAFGETLELEDLGGDSQSGDADIDGVAEDFIAELAAHARAGGTAGRDDHIDPDRVAALASATLDAPNVGPLARHLLLCGDSRCNALLRWEVGGRDAARRVLAGPITTTRPSTPVEKPAKTPPVAPPHASPRVLHLRDGLWDAFRRMSEAKGRSVDDLVEEAMSEYYAARESVEKSPSAKTPSGAPPRSVPVVPPIPSLVPPVHEDDSEVTTYTGPDDGPPTLPPAPNDVATQVSALGFAPCPAVPLGALPNGAAGAPKTPRPLLGPADLRSPEDISECTDVVAIAELNEMDGTVPRAAGASPAPALVAEYAGRRYPVATPRFIIGREPATCHLVLNDTNVSRQHAIVEWANGVYFLVDQGSTNGVGCAGHRVHRKQIAEGDTFEICGHAVRFSFPRAHA